MIFISGLYAVPQDKPKIEPRPAVIIEHTGEQKKFDTEEEAKDFVKKNGGYITKSPFGGYLVVAIPKGRK
jgi:hypothetical protein